MVLLAGCASGWPCGVRLLNYKAVRLGPMDLYTALQLLIAVVIVAVIVIVIWLLGPRPPKR